jgi:hypothetical protein
MTHGLQLAADAVDKRTGWGIRGFSGVMARRVRRGRKGLSAVALACACIFATTPQARAPQVDISAATLDLVASRYGAEASRQGHRVEFLDGPAARPGGCL